jgi:hypothetical protein
MTDWNRVFEIADEMAAVFERRDPYEKNMSYFHPSDVPAQFDANKAAKILVNLRPPTKDFRAVLEARVRAASKADIRRLTPNDRVFLWLHVRDCRDVIKFSELPDAAQSYLYVNDQELFETSFDPNVAKVRQNRDILKLIQDRKILGSFFKRIDDESLAALMHRYPLDLADALQGYRIHKKSHLKVRLANVFDCSKVRNQSHLRSLICRYPWLMQHQTLAQMGASPIKPPTWARILAEIPVEKRVHFPVDTGPWIRRGIFKTKLKVGRDMRTFKDFETGLRASTPAVDNDTPTSVELQHDNDLPTLDAVD